MATRAEVARTDNSKLGRAVLNNRTGQSKAKPVEATVEVAKPATKTKKRTKKSSSKD
jgi:hypothetical protein